MNKAQQKRYDSLYRKHVSALRRQGKAPSTIDVYSRAVRRVCEYFDCPPDTLTQEQLEGYFESLVSTHSWSTVKVDRNGLQFFYQHVLKRQWQWVEIVRPPQVKTLPDVLTLRELERLLNGTRELRYQTFILTCFSMGLRLGEALNLRVGDIDNDVGIKKAITLHTLRHCYGTLLTDMGVSLRAIQEQMGHECPRTTALYTQLSSYHQTDTDQRINSLLARLRVNWGE